MRKRKKVVKLDKVATRELKQLKRKPPVQSGLDPDLRRRRLMTQIRLLEEGAAKWKPRKGELTRQEMLDWSRQITNVVNQI